MGTELGSAAEPTEVVVRPDRARYRRYFAVRWAIAVLMVGAFLAGAWLAGTPVVAGWLVAGAVLLGAIAVAGVGWQHRTYLDPEPALVLGADQFRILHKRRHLWVPWTDVAAVRLQTITQSKGAEVHLLEFELHPGARAKLPPEKAPLVDRMLLWRTNDLIYSRPCDTPRIQEVEHIARRLHAAAGARAS